MAVIELLGPMELGVAIFGEIVAKGMKENAHVRGVTDHLVTMFGNGGEMVKPVRHNYSFNKAVRVAPMSS